MARSTPSPATNPGTWTAAVPAESLALNLIRSLRPSQWTKNLLVFAGLLFGRRLLDAEAVGDALVAFAVFCALSGAVYLINDIADRESDRLSPRRRAPAVRSGS